MTDSKTKYPAHDMISRKTRNYKSHIIHSIIGDIDCGKLENEFNQLLAGNTRYKAALEGIGLIIKQPESQLGLYKPVNAAQIVEMTMIIKEALKGKAGVE